MSARVRAARPECTFYSSRLSAAAAAQSRVYIMRDAHRTGRCVGARGACGPRCRLLVWPPWVARAAVPSLRATARPPARQTVRPYVRPPYRPPALPPSARADKTAAAAAAHDTPRRRRRRTDDATAPRRPPRHSAGKTDTRAPVRRDPLPSPSHRRRASPLEEGRQTECLKKSKTDGNGRAYGNGIQTTINRCVRRHHRGRREG